jgi:hypothetical protein
MMATRSASGTRALKPMKDNVTISKFWIAKRNVAIANSATTIYVEPSHCSSPRCERTSFIAASRILPFMTFKDNVQPVVLYRPNIWEPGRSPD